MTSLDRYVQEAAPSVSGSVRENLLYNTVAYLLSGLKFNELQQVFRQDAGADFTREIRHRMVNDPEVMYHVKFPLYWVSSDVSLRQARADAKLQGLRLKDSMLVDMVVEDGSLKDHVTTLKQTYKPLTIDRFKKEVARAWQNNNQNAWNFARYKLRFLCNWGMKITDLVSDCTEGAYYALLLQYPMIQNRVHLNNIYKQSLRQAGLKLIAYYTAQSRSVFDTEGNLRRLSLNHEVDGQEIQFEGSPEEAAGLMGYTYEQNEKAMYVRSVLQGATLSRREKRLVHYLMDDTDEGFEEWLAVNPTTLHDKDPAAYLTACQQYLQLPSTSIERLRHLLSQGVIRGSQPLLVQPLGW